MVFDDEHEMEPRASAADNKPIENILEIFIIR